MSSYNLPPGVELRDLEPESDTIEEIWEAEDRAYERAKDDSLFAGEEKP